MAGAVYRTGSGAFSEGVLPVAQGGSGGTAAPYVAGGTDVPVADGGTGASTAPAAATNLGLGTGDSPQFTAINLGHASDTTIARSGAGAITVEGVQVLLSGAALGTPASGTLTNCSGLPTTGISTGDLTIGTGGKFTAGTIELGAASDTTIARAAAGRLTVEGVELLRPAAQSDQETGTSNILGVTPGVQHFHQSAAKCWGFTTGAGSPALNAVSYNMTSITDTNTGRLTVTIGNDHSSSSYVVCFGGTTTSSTTAAKIIMVNTKAAGSFEIDSYSAVTPTLSDIVVGFDWCTFGDL